MSYEQPVNNLTQDKSQVSIHHRKSCQFFFKLLLLNIAEKWVVVQWGSQLWNLNDSLTLTEWVWLQTPRASEFAGILWILSDKNKQFIWVIPSWFGHCNLHRVRSCVEETLVHALIKIFMKYFPDWLDFKLLIHIFIFCHILNHSLKPWNDFILIVLHIENVHSALPQRSKFFCKERLLGVCFPLWNKMTLLN